MKHVLISLIDVVFLASGATRVPLTPTDRVPATVATMKLTADKNDNTTVRLVIQHRARPEKLRADLTVYRPLPRNSTSS